MYVYMYVCIIIIIIITFQTWITYHIKIIDKLQDKKEHTPRYVSGVGL